jgi:hypothetical protein
MPALQIRPEEIGRFDLDAYKEVRRRIRQPVRVRPDLSPVRQTPEEFIARELASIARPKGVKIYAFPIGPIRGRDWLNVASKIAAPDLPPPPPRPRRVKVEEIMGIVSTVYQIRIVDLKSVRRTREIVRPRQEAMWLSKMFTTQSLPEIGRRFGGRDHTTVLHAVRTIAGMVERGEYTPAAMKYVQEFQDQLDAAVSSSAAACAEA